MRHKAATALLGLGAFCLALALLVPTVLTPRLLKAPATIDLTTHSRSEAQKLNSATNELEPTTVDLTRRLRTHAASEQRFAGDGERAVYDELLNLAEVGNDGEVVTLDEDGEYAGLRAGASVVAFDRSTGKGVPGFQGDTWETTAQTVKFPFDTKQQTYEYYDQTSQRAWPVSFKGSSRVMGLEVYEFSGTIPETELGQYGELEGTTQIYSNTGRTVLVEPVTGSIVSSTTSPQTSIRFADGTVRPALLVDELVPTDETIAGRVAEAEDSKRSAQLLQRAPWLLGLVGALLLLIGLALAVAGRRSRTDDDDRDDDGLLPSSRRSGDARVGS